MKGYGTEKGNRMDKSNLDQNIIEIEGISDIIRKQNIRVGDISKELYENNILTQQLRKEISSFKDFINQKNYYQKELFEMKGKLTIYTKEVNLLKKQLINEKESKIKVQEELYNMYEKEERLLKSHRKLMLRYRALSNSRLGQLTLAYWKFLKRFKRGNKNGNI